MYYGYYGYGGDIIFSNPLIVSAHTVCTSSTCDGEDTASNGDEWERYMNNEYLIHASCAQNRSDAIATCRWLYMFNRKRNTNILKYLKRNEDRHKPSSLLITQIIQIILIIQIHSDFGKEILWNYTKMILIFWRQEQTEHNPTNFLFNILFYLLCSEQQSELLSIRSSAEMRYISRLLRAHHYDTLDAPEWWTNGFKGRRRWRWEGLSKESNHIHDYTKTDNYNIGLHN